ncbi:MAG: diguanylate cyclase [Celeribacter sp.]
MPGRILIIDPVSINRIILNVKLSSACYDVRQASSLRDAARMLRRDLPDLVLISLLSGQAPTGAGPDDPLPAEDAGAAPRQPCHAAAALRLCRELRRWPISAELPVVMLTDRDMSGLRVRALEAGATDVMPGPEDALLLARLRSLIRLRHIEEELSLRGDGPDLFALAEPVAPFTPAAPVAPLARVDPVGASPTDRSSDRLTMPADRQADRQARPISPAPAARGSIALIGPSAAQAEDWQQSLRPHLPWHLTPMTREQALNLSDPATAPDLFVIAAGEVSHGGGLSLLAELRSRIELRFCKIVITVPADQPDAAAMALDLGASEVVTEPFVPLELALRLRAQFARKHRDDRLRARLRDGLRAAYTDPLTGLYNRRYAMDHLDILRAGAANMRHGFAVLLLDLDRFKQVNDRHGHPTGDRVLCAVADRLSANLRGSDLAARIGGDEFLVLLSETSAEAAQSAAERLCARIAAAPVFAGSLSVTGSPRAPRNLHQTVSVGVLPIPPGDDTVADAASLIAAADRALYRAKRAGRNRVVATQGPSHARPGPCAEPDPYQI